MACRVLSWFIAFPILTREAESYLAHVIRLVGWLKRVKPLMPCSFVVHCVSNFDKGSRVLLGTRDQTCWLAKACKTPLSLSNFDKGSRVLLGTRDQTCWLAKASQSSTWRNSMPYACVDHHCYHHLLPLSQKAFQSQMLPAVTLLHPATLQQAPTCTDALGMQSETTCRTVADTNICLWLCACLSIR